MAGCVQAPSASLAEEYTQADISTSADVFLEGLKKLVVDKVIKTQQVQTLEYRGQQLVIRLFRALASDPERLLKERFAELHSEAKSDAERSRILL